MGGDRSAAQRDMLLARGKSPELPGIARLAACQRRGASSKEAAYIVMIMLGARPDTLTETHWSWSTGNLSHLGGRLATLASLHKFGTRPEHCTIPIRSLGLGPSGREVPARLGPPARRCAEAAIVHRDTEASLSPQLGPRHRGYGPARLP
eukprot:scaffold4189_cov378-Prasinococcus_capsulatus_cf.AAC.16